MKNILTLGSLFLTSWFASQAAVLPNKIVKDSTNKKARMEELKKYRHDLFVQKLALTATEEKGFFPIYDEYELKLREARKGFRQKWKEKKPEDLTEEEAETFMADAIALRETELNLFKTYSEKLKTVIPSKKVVILPRVEREIRKALIEKFKDLRPPKGKGPHGPGGPGGPPPGGPPPDEE